jgi:hypothetical protein
MYSLMLAALYVACRVLFSNMEPVAAIERTLPFLWYWHLTFAIIKFIVWLLIPLFGAAVASSNDRERLAGAAILVASPFVLVMFLFASTLFLGGVYGLDSGIQEGSVVNQSHVVVGSVLYGLAVLLQMKARVSAKPNN